MPYDTESKPRNVLASPLGEEGHEVAKGWTVVRMIMILDVDVTAERRHYNTHRPLKGKRLTTFCASLALLHPLLSLTHWIFRSLMLPYKSSSHSASTAVTDSLDFQVADAPSQIQFAYCKMCSLCIASLRGPRWSILSMLCPVHPFPLRGTSPRWEACHWIFRSLRSLTNPVPLPPQGETSKYVALDIVSHMTQKANPVTLTS